MTHTLDKSLITVRCVKEEVYFNIIPFVFQPSTLVLVHLKGGIYSLVHFTEFLSLLCSDSCIIFHTGLGRLQFHLLTLIDTTLKYLAWMLLWDIGGDDCLTPPLQQIIVQQFLSYAICRNVSCILTSAQDTILGDKHLKVT